jgi:hypothetical protein
MTTPNAERALATIIRDAARDLGIAVESLGEGWVLRLTRGPVVRSIHGYSFDLNGAATHAIACDKSATSDVLDAAGVPRIEHRLFLHPDLARYVHHDGNWERMLRFFESAGRDVVVKDNTGTGGQGVYRARSPIELEAAVLTLFSRGRSAALSPFAQIADETRLIVLDGRCEVAYAKVRPQVVGDGRSTVLELLADRVRQAGVTPDISRYLASLDPEAAAVLAEVPRMGRARLLNWRHNLGQGAAVRLLDPADQALAPHRDLALRAARAMNLRFGSVDVASLSPGSPGPAHQVLEVNSGVMMEALSGVPGGQHAAARVYRHALELLFA